MTLEGYEETKHSKESLASQTVAVLVGEAIGHHWRKGRSAT